MTTVVLDYETRSRVNIKKSGPWPYAEDKSTNILCAAIKIDAGPTLVWHNPQIYDSTGTIGTDNLISALNKADIIEAHNSAFERAITHHIAIGRYGWEIDPGWENKLRCTASRAAAMGLPPSLDGACSAMHLPVQKDKAGKAVMLKLCSPDKNGEWNEGPEDLATLARYCIQDVEAEYGLSKALRPLSLAELLVWQLDQKINAIGIPLDIDLTNSAIKLLDQYEEKALPEIAEITGGAVDSPRQVAALLTWLSDNGCHLKDLTAGRVKEALENMELSPKVRRALGLRESLGKSSVSKFSAMLACASEDGRARDTMMYAGANTGRWSGKRVQPHNFPRKSLHPHTDFYIDLVRAGRLDLIEALSHNPIDVFSALLRPAIQAQCGNELVAADFNAIEGRGLAWEAGEDHILDDYRAGIDPYKRVASIIFGVPYEQITKVQRQSGKIAELACGYRGGPGAAKKFGATGTDAEIRAKFITPWRDNRPATVQFWSDIEQAALSAVMDDQGRAYRCRVVTYGKNGNILYCRLPSGRLLAYHNPVTAWVGAIKFEDDDSIYKTRLAQSKTEAEIGLNELRMKFRAKIEEWAMAKLAVTVESYDSIAGRMERKPVHGGIWTERVTQAICRDILAAAMLRLDRAGYQIVMHIHDEIVCEVVKGSANLDDYISIFSQPPPWAPGFPIGAEGWVNEYLKKE
jgi:DNA polymerase